MTPIATHRARRKRAKPIGIRSRRSTDKGETSLGANVMRYLRTQQDVWAERRNAGSRPLVANGVKRYVKFGEPGTPDVTGYLRPKRQFYIDDTPFEFQPAIPFAIELKSRTGKLNANQRAWHAKAERFGVPVCVARSVSEAKAFIEGLRRGDWSSPARRAG